MKRFHYIITAVIISTNIYSRGITTVAGNGTLGYSGDGGNATGAELNTPYGTCFDALGNLYIADA